MIYPETLEAKLGFDLIRTKLKNYCLSPAGQEWVDIMKFTKDYDFINILLRQNLEFRLIFEKGEAFPSRHFFDPVTWFQKISIGGHWLEAEEFLDLAYGMEAIFACKLFL